MVPAMQETWVQFLDQKIPWRRKWQPTPVFLPGEFHSQRSLVGYSLWGHKELDMTKGICGISFLAYQCVMGYTDWFSNVEATYIAGVNHTWSWFIILFTYCWIQFDNIILILFNVDFCIRVHERDWCVAFLFVTSLSFFCYQGNASIIE